MMMTQPDWWAGLPDVALSIRQPWPWGILHCGKDIENREWRTAFRGPVCIHASAGMTREEYGDFIDAMAITLVGSGWRADCMPVPGFGDLRRGGIVGVVDIVDCVTASDSPWFFGPYGFVLRNARPVDFIPVKGKLGFFQWRNQVLDAAADLLATGGAST